MDQTLYLTLRFIVWKYWPLLFSFVFVCFSFVSLNGPRKHWGDLDLGLISLQYMYATCPPTGGQLKKKENSPSWEAVALVDAKGWAYGPLAHYQSREEINYPLFEDCQSFKQNLNLVASVSNSTTILLTKHRVGQSVAKTRDIQTTMRRRSKEW